MAVDTLLQTQLFQSGVLWQLVPHLFHYDYTLDEGGGFFHLTISIRSSSYVVKFSFRSNIHLGVSHSEESNKQALANRLARISCEALACLAGFR